jgi:hypothetical protein
MTFSTAIGQFKNKCENFSFQQGEKQVIYSVLEWNHSMVYLNYRGAYKSLARPTSRCILFDGENISFDASLVIYINSTNIPPLVIINKIYEHQNLLSL